MKQEYKNNALCIWLNAEICKKDVNTLKFDGEPLFNTVVATGNSLAVQFLIERGADIYKQDSKGYTPLDIAISSGRLDIVEILEKASNSAKSYSALTTPLATGPTKKDNSKKMSNQSAQPTSTDIQTLIYSAAASSSPSQSTAPANPEKTANPQPSTSGGYLEYFTSTCYSSANTMVGYMGYANTQDQKPKPTVNDPASQGYASYLLSYVWR
jgi:hypothetical protein